MGTERQRKTCAPRPVHRHCPRDERGRGGREAREPHRFLAAVRNLHHHTAPNQARIERLEPLHPLEAVERQLEKLADIQNDEINAHENAGQSGMVVRLFPQQNYGFIEIDNSSELYFTRCEARGRCGGLTRRRAVANAIDARFSNYGDHKASPASPILSRSIEPPRSRYGALCADLCRPTAPHAMASG